MSLEDEITRAMALSNEELIETLGVTALGTAGTEEAASSRTILLSVAEEMNPIAARSLLSKSLMERGEALFSKLWEQTKGIVCYIYREGIKVEEEADLVKYLAGAIIAAGAIANALVVLVVTIAVKRGLDLLCPVPEKK